MSTSCIYHVMGLQGYEYVHQKFEGGGIKTELISQIKSKLLQIISVIVIVRGLLLCRTTFQRVLSRAWKRYRRSFPHVV